MACSPSFPFALPIATEFICQALQEHSTMQHIDMLIGVKVTKTYCSEACSSTGQEQEKHMKDGFDGSLPITKKAPALYKPHTYVIMMDCSVSISSGATHQLVQNYLRYYGYGDTLQAFDTAAGLTGPVASTSGR